MIHLTFACLFPQSLQCTKNILLANVGKFQHDGCIICSHPQHLKNIKLLGNAGKKLNLHEEGHSFTGVMQPRGIDALVEDYYSGLERISRFSMSIGYYER